MKTVLIGPVYPYRGGISHHTTMLASALKTVSDCRVISFKRQYPKRLYPGRTDIDPSKQILGIDAEYLLDPLNPLSWTKTARDIIRLQPDQLVIQWWVTVWGPLVATLGMMCRREGVPITFIVHNVFPHEAKPWDKQISRFTLRLGDHHIVHSQQERRRLIDLIPEVNATLVPHPLYNMFRENSIPREQAKITLGIDPGMTALLFFGMVREYKGLKYLIQALKLLKEARHPTKLIIAGEFWSDRKAYMHLIEELGLHADILIEDRYIPNEEVGVYFSAADIVMVPYTEGTQSGVAAIASAFGLPIIATDHIRSGMTAPAIELTTSVEPASADAIARAVLEVTSKQISEAIQPEKDTSWQRLVQAILFNRREDSSP